MNWSSNRKSLNYSKFFALDVLVVMRGDRVVRVMGNAPGTRVVILNLGDKKHPPGLRYFGALGTSWDPFEMEAYIAEYLKRTGNEEGIQQDVDIESLRRRAEELLRMRQEKVTFDKRGNVLWE
jgi:hypothetical protein